MDEKLKVYAAPVIGVIVLVAWFFVIRPMIDGDSGDGADKAEEKKYPGAPDPNMTEEERRRVPDDPAQRVQ